MREQVKNQLLMAAAGAGLLLGAQAFLRRSNAYNKADVTDLSAS